MGCQIMHLIITSLVLVISIFTIFGDVDGQTTRRGNFIPDQIHIALGNDYSEMTIMWVTPDDPGESLVRFGESVISLFEVVNGSRKELLNGVIWPRRQIVHKVTLTGLKPYWRYWYQCGSQGYWSRTYSLLTIPDGEDWSPRLAVYGDLGLDNARSVPSLISEARKGLLHAIFHNGDIAYDLHTLRGSVGDRFFRLIEPMAARVPYMVSVGNHESFMNFSNYKTRFGMPGTEDNMRYTFKLGPALFIVLSTEVYYFLEHGGPQAVRRQFDWLEIVLKEANRPENRARWPWIITFGHRPMYCSTMNIFECINDQTRVRTGVPWLRMESLETLLHKYNVDLSIWAHEHSYERLWPVYNRQVYNGSYNEPYTNPKATVHVTIGTAGNRENLARFPRATPPWAAFRSTEYGYAHLTIHNKTHLHMEQIGVDRRNKVLDQFWIIKEEPVIFGKRFTSSPDYTFFSML